MSGKRLTGSHLLLSFVLVLIVLFAASTPAVEGNKLSTDLRSALDVPPNLLLNGSFEEGEGDTPTGWLADSNYLPPLPGDLQMVRDNSVAFTGSHSIRITALVPTDSRWLQTVAVEPHTLYRLSGWIKTENVDLSVETVHAGANLSLFGTWTRSRPFLGTHDWTYVTLDFNSDTASEVNVAARLGYWAGTTTGTVWFDDLRLARLQVEPDLPHPQWKILTLIYPVTDFAYTDGSGRDRHVIGQLTATEVEEAGAAAELFAQIDIPALTSGNMIPTLTVRVVEHPLSHLDPYIGDTWWPGPRSTEADRDPAFDSVIVIWQPWVVDQDTGVRFFITGAEGLTPAMGTGQTYTAFTIDGAIYRGHRNVFKHEWGHSITSYHDAAGVAPKPAVNIHIGPGNMYVHCPTGEAYLLVDEDLATPIPNSIYNNESGFSHDYYSGTTAQPEDPGTCLGITPEAWAHGGPVSRMFPEFRFLIEPIAAGLTGPPATSLLYTIQVTNTGVMADVFEVALPPSGSWSVYAHATVGPLASGESALLQVRVYTPADAAPGTSTETPVTITSRGNPELVAEAILTTTVVEPCYTLGRTHSGNGADPVASPAASAGCSTGEYVAGAAIDLTASPDSGWLVSGWNGTSDDNSRSLNNSVTMPASDHTVTANYEQAPSLAFGSASFMVDEDGGSATIEVVRSGSPAATITVEYATTDDTAKAGDDYTGVNDTLTFNSGEMSKRFAVPITDDSLDEENETVNLALQNPTNATLGTPATALLTIVDNDGPVIVAFSNKALAVSESDGAANLTVALSSVSGHVVTVTYTIVSGTATLGEDYVSASGTLTFNPGETTRALSVPIVEDTVQEPDETFTVTLENPANAVLGMPAATTVTIVDDDLPPPPPFALFIPVTVTEADVFSTLRR